jgi:hypothetical protein
MHYLNRIISLSKSKITVDRKKIVATVYALLVCAILRKNSIAPGATHFLPPPTFCFLFFLALIKTSRQLRYACKLVNSRNFFLKCRSFVICIAWRVKSTKQKYELNLCMSYLTLEYGGNCERLGAFRSQK